MRSIKPWFLTERKLAAVLIIPSSWGSQRIAITRASLFSSSSPTLRVLQIGRSSISDATVHGFEFSMLKQLGLDLVDIKSERSFYNMIASCPVLDCLHMSTCYGVKCLRINSPSLRRIGVRNGSVADNLILDQLIILGNRAKTNTTGDKPTRTRHQAHSPLADGTRQPSRGHTAT